jgi:hypothetical protein
MATEDGKRKDWHPKLRQHEQAGCHKSLLLRSAPVHNLIAAFFFDFASQKHIFTKGRQKDIFSHPHGALFF